ncbi:SDR family NAD(P)-dependent oxidoreductase [Nocardia alba]|nr:SDR family NAD(P)-dependent oxidoreductase [Nocardia alba]
MLLTGATSGLGLSMARLLAGVPDWTVVATARSGTRAEELRALIGDPANFRYVVCDQADLASVRDAGSRINELVATQSIPPLRSLVLNAGIQTGSTDSATVDGYELTFGTNLVGPHLLVGLLSGALTAPARIICVGSGTHYGKFRRSYGMVAAPRWEAPQILAKPRAGDGIRAYSTSKLATLYWVHELARRAPRHIDAICYDPGMMPGTGLARDRSAIERFGWKYLLPAMRVVPGVSTPKRSATNLTAIATANTPIPEVDLRGGYVEIDHLVPSSPDSYDPEREHELFEFLDTTTGLGSHPVAPWWSGGSQPID